MSAYGSPNDERVRQMEKEMLRIRRADKLKARIWALICAAALFSPLFIGWFERAAL